MFEAIKRLFSPAHGAPRLRTPPAGARQRAIRLKGGACVRATLAAHDGVIHSPRGDLHYRAGQHYIVRYDMGDDAPVQRAIFERTYRRRADGRYEKRRDVILHYFTLPYEAEIETLEGVRRAAPGDWIVQGVMGELYPVPDGVGRAKYEPV